MRLNITQAFQIERTHVNTHDLKEDKNEAACAMAT